MTITVKAQRLGGDLRQFLDVVERIYRDDPCYVRPLDIDVRQRLSPKHPYFAHGDGMVFVAHKDGMCAGRVVAHTNRMHTDRHKDGVGFFGFLDTINDAEVCSELIRSVASWHRAEGTQRLRGPITLNMGEEVGCLVEGFDHPPMILMGHHRPYQAALLEAAGLSKVKDAYAWRYETGQVSALVLRGRDSIRALPEVKVRRVDMKRLDQDIPQMLDIYNEAWEETWAHVPLTPAEARRAASEFKLVANPELSRIVEVDGVPSAFAYALPNINEALAGLHGKLLPLGAIKALWRIKVQGLRSARLVALGIRKNVRSNRRYAGMSAFLYSELNDSGLREHIPWGELSFTLEDNHKMNAGVKLMGAQIYKRYRIFEMAL